MQWELRTAAIKEEGGEVLFEQNDCEIPATWSQLATNVVVSKYFYGEINTPERERSVRQLIHRVTRTIADWGTAGRLFCFGGGWRAFLSRSDLALLASARGVQFARLVQRWPVSSVRREGRQVQLALDPRDLHRQAAGKPVRISARLGLLYPKRARQHGRHHASWRPAKPCSSSLARAPAPTCRRSVRIAKSFPAVASHRARCRSCGFTIRLRPW